MEYLQVDFYELLSSPKQNVQSEVFSFSEANKLSKAKLYAGSLLVYVNLTEQNKDSSIYSRSAFNCYMLAMQYKQPIQQELVSRLKRLL